MERKRLTPEQRRALREALSELREGMRELRLLFERIEARQQVAREVEARRRARLRRLTFGLLGRS